jgi:branched-chain amino acid aminotransferase
LAVTVVAFRDGEFSPLNEMTVGIGTHALHYGTNVFEGIRAYWNADASDLFVFRPREHYARLHVSAGFFGMRLPHTVDDLCAITAELLVRNGVQEDTYIRPLLFKSSDGIGVWRSGLEDSFVIFSVPMDKYIADGGIRCCVSSWRRPDGNTAPARAKVGGIYAAMALARRDAMANGFDEAITLTANGSVAEGTAENIFLVIDGRLVTPGCGGDLLAGITRASVIELAISELGLEVVERSVNRSELYCADELFLCGTAAEVTPVLEIDGWVVGDGQIGSMTKAIRDLYSDVVHGKSERYLGWCRPVYAGAVA